MERERKKKEEEERKRIEEENERKLYVTHNCFSFGIRFLALYNDLV